MFKAANLEILVKKFEGTFLKLKQVEQTLNDRFLDLQNPIEALILSLASGEPLLLVGPPGTAKSRLIRALCAMLGLLNENDPTKDHPDYFEYLLTPFTEPNELFGYYDIPKLIHDTKMMRIEDGANMMQQASVVYLDEVFNGSSAILNSILTFLNERIFHDHGKRIKVKMKCLFGATNNTPDASELKAVFDRFILRCHVENVPDELGKVADLIGKGWRETYRKQKIPSMEGNLLAELELLRQTIREWSEKSFLDPAPKHPFYQGVTQMIEHAREYDLSRMSNRRIVKMVHIMLIHRLYRAVCRGEKKDICLGNEQLELIPKYFLDHFDQELVDKMVSAAHQ